MVQASMIRQHMDVIGSDGAMIGKVDEVEGERIKLTKTDSADHAHHYVPLSAVDHVDAHVHLNSTAAALGILGAAAAGTGTAAAAGSFGQSGGEAPLPPVKNRAVEDAPPRRNFYLPWIVGIVGLILLALLLKSCMEREEPVATTTAAPAVGPIAVESVALPDGSKVDLTPGSFNYTLQRYLASAEATPRTFTFDNLNFDTASAAIRTEDQGTIDALGQILAAYPNARGRIVGYTDARGSDPANAQLGQQRADAVIAALGAKGIAAGRLEATTGGESNPADTNATAEGQFDNRRTELVVTTK